MDELCIIKGQAFSLQSRCYDLKHTSTNRSRNPPTLTFGIPTPITFTSLPSFQRKLTYYFFVEFLKSIYDTTTHYNKMKLVLAASLLAAVAQAAEVSFFLDRDCNPDSKMEQFLEVPDESGNVEHAYFEDDKPISMLVVGYATVLLTEKVSSIFDQKTCPYCANVGQCFKWYLETNVLTALDSITRMRVEIVQWMMARSASTSKPASAPAMQSLLPLATQVLPICRAGTMQTVATFPHHLAMAFANRRKLVVAGLS